MLIFSLYSFFVFSFQPYLLVLHIFFLIFLILPIPFFLVVILFPFFICNSKWNCCFISNCWSNHLWAKQIFMPGIIHIKTILSFCLHSDVGTIYHRIIMLININVIIFSISTRLRFLYMLTT